MSYLVLITVLWCALTMVPEAFQAERAMARNVQFDSAKLAEQGYSLTWNDELDGYLFQDEKGEVPPFLWYTSGNVDASLVCQITSGVEGWTYRYDVAISEDSRQPLIKFAVEALPIEELRIPMESIVPRVRNEAGWSYGYQHRMTGQWYWNQYIDDHGRYLYQWSGREELDFIVGVEAGDTGRFTLSETALPGLSRCYGQGISAFGIYDLFGENDIPEGIPNLFTQWFLDKDGVTGWTVGPVYHPEDLEDINLRELLIGEVGQCSELGWIDIEPVKDALIEMLSEINFEEGMKEPQTVLKAVKLMNRVQSAYEDREILREVHDLIVFKVAFALDRAGWQTGREWLDKRPDLTEDSGGETGIEVMSGERLSETDSS